jgi:hypothetical protein
MTCHKYCAYLKAVNVRPDLKHHWHRNGYNGTVIANTMVVKMSRIVTAVLLFGLVASKVLNTILFGLNLYEIFSFSYKLKYLDKALKKAVDLHLLTVMLLTFIEQDE